MGISSSLFSGISGLSTHGNAMSVIGDNIANVNTIGFKSSRTSFEDVLSQSVSTASGSSQIGRGTALSCVDTLFQQGSFESTSNATDLAIGVGLACRLRGTHRRLRVALQNGLRDVIQADHHPRLGVVDVVAMDHPVAGVVGVQIYRGRLHRRQQHRVFAQP